MSFFRRAAAGCALLAVALATPAQANCWADDARAAASVRELQTMLMVAALRCRARGVDILADYNGFVQASRTALEAANLALKMQFADGGGGQVEYDRFTTLLANAYGDAATDATTCAEAAAAAHDAAATPAQLRRVASLKVFPRTLPGGYCAAPAAVAPAPPIATIAAAPMPQRVVTLPDEVVAALTVMARYGTIAPVPAPAAAPAPAMFATAAH